MLTNPIPIRVEVDRLAARVQFVAMLRTPSDVLFCPVCGEWHLFWWCAADEAWVCCQPHEESENVA